MNIILATNKTDMDICLKPTSLSICASCIFPSDDDFLHIFVPMIDDEERRRSEELDKEETEKLDDEFEDDEQDEE